MRDNRGKINLESYPEELQALFNKIESFFSKHGCDVKDEPSLFSFLDTLKKMPNNAYLDFLEALSKHVNINLSQIQANAFNSYYKNCEKANKDRKTLFKEHLRDDFEITWLVRGNTVYDSSVSLPNLCFLYLIEKYSDVKIKRSEIDDKQKHTLTEQGWLVHFKDGSDEYFNRVVIRHGLTIGKLDQKFKLDKKELPQFQDIGMASAHREFKKGKIINSSMKDDIEEAYAKLCSHVTRDKTNSSLDVYQHQLIRSARYTAGLENLPSRFASTYTHKKFVKFILEYIDDESGKFPSCGFINFQKPLAEIQQEILQPIKKKNSV